MQHCIVFLYVRALNASTQSKSIMSNRATDRFLQFFDHLEILSNNFLMIFYIKEWPVSFALFENLNTGCKWIMTYT